MVVGRLLGDKWRRSKILSEWAQGAFGTSQMWAWESWRSLGRLPGFWLEDFTGNPGWGAGLEYRLGQDDQVELEITGRYCRGNDLPFLSKLYTRHWAWIHNPKIKGHRLSDWASQVPQDVIYFHVIEASWERSRLERVATVWPSTCS